MKLEFRTAFRVYIVALLLLLAWSVWQAGAQTNVETGAVIAASGSASNSVAIAVAQAGAPVQRPTPQWIKNLGQSFPFLLDQWWGNEVWKYLFSLIYIFLAFYVSKLLDYLTRIWLKRWATRTTTSFDDLLLDLLNGPIKIVAFVIFLRIGLDVFQWPAVVHSILTKGFTVIVAFSLTYMAVKFVDLVMGYWRKQAKAETDRAFDEHLFPIVRKSLKVFVVVVALLVTLANLGVNITAAIASLSIGGLAVGLAAQDTLANLFGAVAIFMDKPFRIGDRVQLDGVDGTVESIGMRSTRIRNLEGYMIAVPNKTMGSATITNITLRPNIKTEINLGLTYDTPVEKMQRALEILQEVYGRHAMTHELTLSFNKFTDSALNIQIVHWWKGSDGKAYTAGMQELNLAVKKRFDAEGIDFAYPTRTLHLKQDGGPRPVSSRSA